jgi:hypothetical protein
MGNARADFIAEIAEGSTNNSQIQSATGPSLLSKNTQKRGHDSRDAARPRGGSDLTLVRPWGSAVSFMAPKILTPHLWIISRGVLSDAWYQSLSLKRIRFEPHRGREILSLTASQRINLLNYTYRAEAPLIKH